MARRRKAPMSTPISATSVSAATRLTPRIVCKRSLIGVRLEQQLDALAEAGYGRLEVPT